MSRYTFETIEYKRNSHVKAFLASIQSSQFHWHYEYELLIVLKGSIRVRLESEEYVLLPEDILLVNSCVIHSIECTAGENLCGVIQLDPGLFQMNHEDKRYYHFSLNSAGQALVPKCGYGHFVRRCARILNCTLLYDDLSYFLIRSEVYGFIADLMSMTEYNISLKTSQMDMTGNLLMDIIKYLEENLIQEHLAEQTCLHFGIGEKSMHRFFKSSIGKSLRAFITELRIDRAKKLLQGTEKNMNQILDECGFGSEKSFYRQFQQHTNLTPSAYRKQGIQSSPGGSIRGYLDFEDIEARELLEQLIHTSGEQYRIEEDAIDSGVQ